MAPGGKEGVPPVEVDGSRYSGSGTIVRLAVAFSALTGRPVHVVNARVRRPNPGLRRQHVQVVEAIRQLVDGTTSGVHQGSLELLFSPGLGIGQEQYLWDIGSGGSTTMLALAVLPVLAFRPRPVQVEIRGGIFQDFAPSFFHLESVMIPLLRRMGVEAEVSMARPGYVPAGGGVLRLTTRPARRTLQPLVLDRPGRLERLWGVALASHLAQRQVAHRMAEAAQEVLAREGYGPAQIREVEDSTAVQAGAALALFADLEGGVRLGADRAGAPGRRSESIGRQVAQALVEDLRSGATLDRYAADQIIPFAALAAGESRFRIPQVTDHVQTAAWLAQEFLGARVALRGLELVVEGVGYRRGAGTGGATQAVG